MHALEVENVIKDYKNQIIALQGISLKIDDGDFYALIGPNAAGKSTLIGIITSLIKKSSGKVTIYGHNIDNPKEQEEAKLKIGLVPQNFNFNPNEKVINILIKQAGLYGIEADIAKQRSEYYLQLLCLWNKRNAEARHLSGGQMRCLILARALIHQPKLLILDEPTSGVDIETRHLIWNFLKDLNAQGTTLILTTHYLEEAEHLCKNVSFLDQGRIVGHYKMNDLLKSSNMETIILHLEKPLLDSFSFNNFSSRFVNPTTLEVFINEDQTMNELFNEIGHHRLNIRRFQNKTNKLEKLFLDLMSKKNEE